MPSTTPLVSIIIDNYNYARFLSESIDSALAQTYRNKEVIVVDDGSTDSSREIMTRYSSSIIPVLKDNGGQASAFNAGFVESHGSIVVFLDSDDVLLPHAIEHIVPNFDNDRIAKVHWPLWIVNTTGERTGEMRPPSMPPDGDVAAMILERGPSNYPSPPTSGNAWARWCLERLMPVPEDVNYYRSCADEYLYTCAPAFGIVRGLAEPQSLYRIHGGNVYSAKSYDERLRMELAGYDQQCQAISATFKRNGLSADVGAWKRYSWFHRLAQALHVIREHVPPNGDFVLIDGGRWNLAEVFGSHVHPFLEHDRVDWGDPEGDEQAIAQFETWRNSAIQYLVIAWHCFWWRESYPRLFQHLESIAVQQWRTDDVVIYRFNRPA